MSTLSADAIGAAESMARERFLDEGKLLQSGPSEFKQDGDVHTVEAVVATLGVTDKQGDVIVAGSVGKQSVLLSPFNHSSAVLPPFMRGEAAPAGKGFIEERGDELVFVGEFFNTVAAQESFEVLSKTQDEMEWSFGFKAIDFSFGELEDEPVIFLNKLTVFEASPVMRGAGMNTRTINVKSGFRFGADVEAARWAVEHIVERAHGLRDARLSAGKALGLTDDRTGELDRLAELLVKAGADLRALLEPAPEPSETVEALNLAALAQLQQFNARRTRQWL